MAFNDSTQRGPAPQSSGPAGLPGPAPGAVSAGPLPACHLAGLPGRRPRAPSSSSPGLTIARVPSPARPAVACRPLKRPAEAILTRTSGLVDGLPPGPTAARNHGWPSRERPCARRGPAPGVPPAGKRAGPAAGLFNTPAGGGLPSGLASRDPKGCRKVREGGTGRGGPGPTAPDPSTYGTALKGAASRDACDTPEGPETRT